MTHKIFIIVHVNGISEFTSQISRSLMRQSSCTFCKTLDSLFVSKKNDNRALICLKCATTTCFAFYHIEPALNTRRNVLLLLLIWEDSFRGGCAWCWAIHTHDVLLLSCSFIQLFFSCFRKAKKKCWRRKKSRFCLPLVDVEFRLVRAKKNPIFGCQITIRWFIIYLFWVHSTLLCLAVHLYLFFAKTFNW